MTDPNNVCVLISGAYKYSILTSKGKLQLWLLKIWKNLLFKVLQVNIWFIAMRYFPTWNEWKDWETQRLVFEIKKGFRSQDLKTLGVWKHKEMSVLPEYAEIYSAPRHEDFKLPRLQPDCQSCQVMHFGWFKT